MSDPGHPYNIIREETSSMCQKPGDATLMHMLTDPNIRPQTAVLLQRMYKRK